MPKGFFVLLFLRIGRDISNVSFFLKRINLCGTPLRHTGYYGRRRRRLKVDFCSKRASCRPPAENESATAQWSRFFYKRESQFFFVADFFFPLCYCHCRATMYGKNIINKTFFYRLCAMRWRSRASIMV